MKLNKLKISVLYRFSLLIFSFGFVLHFSNAQDIKGASRKTGSSFSSSFRESIARVQKQLVQPRPASTLVTFSQKQSSDFSQEPVQQQQIIQSTSKFESQQQQQQSISEPLETIYGSVKGTTGVDFPAYSSIPNTPFSCDGLPYNPGMYADESTGCQVYHLCYNGRRESFLCGIGTVFNQAILGCDFWHSVECSKSSQYYHLNAEFGKSSSEPAAGLQQRRVSSSSKQTIREQKLIQIRPTPIIPQTVISSVKVEEQSLKQVPLPRPATGTSFVSSTKSFSSNNNILPVFEGKTARKGFGQNSFQQSSSGLLSPGRRLSLQTRVDQQQQQQQQQQLDSESSMQVMARMSTNSSKVEYSLNERLAENGIKTNDAVSSLKNRSLLSPTIKEDSTAWRPFYKSKQVRSTKVGSMSGSQESVWLTPQNEPNRVTMTTSSPRQQQPATSESQANQEPTFSRVSESSPSSTVKNETPEIPKNEPPSTVPQVASSSEMPPTTTTSTTPKTGEESSLPATIESDVSAALSTTSTTEVNPTEASTSSETVTGSISSEATSSTVSSNETSMSSPEVEENGASTTTTLAPTSIASIDETILSS